MKCLWKIVDENDQKKEKSGGLTTFYENHKCRSCEGYAFECEVYITRNHLKTELNPSEIEYWERFK